MILFDTLQSTDALKSQEGWVLAEWLVGSSIMLAVLSAALGLMGDLHAGRQALNQHSSTSVNQHMAASMLRQQLQGLEQSGSYSQILQHTSGSPMWLIAVMAQPQWPLNDCVGHSGSEGELLTSRYWIDRSTLYCMAGSNPVAQPLVQGMDSFQVQLWQQGPEGLQLVETGQQARGPLLRRVQWGWITDQQRHQWTEALSP